jgi:hypothetical protein
VCWELLTQTAGWGWEEPSESEGAARPAMAVGAAVADSDVGPGPSRTSRRRFFSAVADAVTWAMYWQERSLPDPPDDGRAALLA